jgi:hypothetical protein
MCKWSLAFTRHAIEPHNAIIVATAYIQVPIGSEGKTFRPVQLAILGVYPGKRTGNTVISQQLIRRPVSDKKRRF